MPRRRNHSPKRPANQHKPLPPEDELRPLVEKYHGNGLSDVEALKHIQTTYLNNRPEFGLSVVSLRRLRKKWGILSTRQQDHTLDTALPHLSQVRERYPLQGMREMKRLLVHEEGVRVSKRVIQSFFENYEPEGILSRKARRLRRKRFWSVGVNDMWCLDQHDKWKRFGLKMHLGMEPYSGLILWLRIWWTNSDPRLICKYYLDTIEKRKIMPLVTQSDPGVENYRVAYAQTVLRHLLDPSLEGSIQHRWMRKSKNVKPEIVWGQMHRRWSYGFENILQVGLDNDYFRCECADEVVVFRWTFIPWLQAELDSWISGVNCGQKRADKNKILPHGRPQMIYEAPEQYGTSNLGLQPDQAHLDRVRAFFCPYEHPVFQLVPPEVDQCLAECYGQLGHPSINHKSVWDVYSRLLNSFRTRLQGLPNRSQLIHIMNSCIDVEDNPNDNYMNMEEFPGVQFEGLQPETEVDVSGGLSGDDDVAVDGSVAHSE